MVDETLRRHWRTLVIAVIVPLLVGAALAVWVRPAGGSTVGDSPTKYLVGHAGTGETLGRFPLGSDGSIDTSADMPDLVEAFADDGTAGYLRSSDVAQITSGESAPRTPHEALQRCAVRRSLPVYAADGTTVVGRLTASEPRTIDLSLADIEGRNEDEVFLERVRDLLADHDSLRRDAAGTG